jgi:tetratricopeptide (TPR) repeat protein
MSRFIRTLRRPSFAALGDQARDKGEWDVAAALYSNALAEDLRNSPIWVQYGHALKESGKLQDPVKLAKAEAAYRRALLYAPRIADTHLQLGHVLKLQGQIDEAKAAYLRARALDPELSFARDELRALGWEEGGAELPAALASLDGAAPPRRRRPSLIEQADAARDAAQWTLAIRCYRTVLERDSGNATRGGTRRGVRGLSRQPHIARRSGNRRLCRRSAEPAHRPVFDATSGKVLRHAARSGA